MPCACWELSGRHCHIMWHPGKSRRRYCLTISQRVEKHVLKPSHSHYARLLDFCQRSKNLYNHANYLIRQSYFQTGTVLGYCELDKLLKADTAYPDYTDMPTAQSAQQTLRALSANWKAFLHALKEFHKHPDKFLGRPKPPKYLNKNGCFSLILTNQNCKLKQSSIHFPKVFHGFQVQTKCDQRPGFQSFQQVRILPKSNRLIIEIVYKIAIPDAKSDNGRCVGVDLGVGNLAVVANNFYAPAFMLNGRPLKAINQFYNKRRAACLSELEIREHKKYSRRLSKLDGKRDNRVRDYMHKASHCLVDWCACHDVSKIIIGKNDGWKQQSRMGKTSNQNFIGIPHARFIEMIRYKAEERGIVVITTEEGYTSGTSVIDNEPPEKAYYDKSRRKARGMFYSNAGIAINADLNAAYQIMKKVILFQWDSGCVLHPVIRSF